MKKLIPVALLSTLAVIATTRNARADVTVTVTEPGIGLGGHVGLALPLLSVGGSTTGIGKDFFSLGISTGVTLKFDSHWSIDLETVAYDEFKNTQLVSFVVDPGLLYNFGPVVVGGRIATKLGGGQTTNVGIVPIVVAPFKISPKLSYFVELDVPIFFSDKASIANTPGSGINSPTGVQPSFNLQFQTGIGF